MNVLKLGAAMVEVPMKEEQFYPGLWLVAKNATTVEQLREVDRVIFDSVALLDEENDLKQIHELNDLGTQIQIKISKIEREAHYEAGALMDDDEYEEYCGSCHDGGCINCEPENYLEYTL